MLARSTSVISSAICVTAAHACDDWSVVAAKRVRSASDRRGGGLEYLVGSTSVISSAVGVTAAHACDYRCADRCWRRARKAIRGNEEEDNAKPVKKSNHRCEKSEGLATDTNDTNK